MAFSTAQELRDASALAKAALTGPPSPQSAIPITKPATVMGTFGGGSSSSSPAYNSSSPVYNPPPAYTAPVSSIPSSGSSPGTYVTSEGTYEVTTKPWGTDVTRIGSVGTIAPSSTTYITPEVTAPAREAGYTKEVPDIFSEAEVVRNVRLDAVEFNAGQNLPLTSPTSIMTYGQFAAINPAGSSSIDTPTPSNLDVPVITGGIVNNVIKNSDSSIFKPTDLMTGMSVRDSFEVSNDSAFKDTGWKSTGFLEMKTATSEDVVDVMKAVNIAKDNGLPVSAAGAVFKDTTTTGNKYLIEPVGDTFLRQNKDDLISISSTPQNKISNFFLNADNIYGVKPILEYNLGAPVVAVRQTLTSGGSLGENLNKNIETLNTQYAEQRASELALSINDPDKFIKTAVVKHATNVGTGLVFMAPQILAMPAFAGVGAMGANVVGAARFAQITGVGMKLFRGGEIVLGASNFLEAKSRLEANDPGFIVPAVFGGVLVKSGVSGLKTEFTRTVKPEVSSVNEVESPMSMTTGNVAAVEKYSTAKGDIIKNKETDIVNNDMIVRKLVETPKEYISSEGRSTSVTRLPNKDIVTLTDIAPAASEVGAIGSVRNFKSVEMEIKYPTKPITIKEKLMDVIGRRERDITVGNVNFAEGKILEAGKAMTPESVPDKLPTLFNDKTGGTYTDYSSISNARDFGMGFDITTGIRYGDSGASLIDSISTPLIMRGTPAGSSSYTKITENVKRFASSDSSMDVKFGNEKIELLIDNRGSVVEKTTKDFFGTNELIKTKGVYAVVTPTDLSIVKTETLGAPMVSGGGLKIRSGSGSNVGGFEFGGASPFEGFDSIKGESLSAPWAKDYSGPSLKSQNVIIGSDSSDYYSVMHGQDFGAGQSVDIVSNVGQRSSTPVTIYAGTRSFAQDSGQSLIGSQSATQLGSEYKTGSQTGLNLGSGSKTALETQVGLQSGLKTDIATQIGLKTGLGLNLQTGLVTGLQSRTVNITPVPPPIIPNVTRSPSGSSSASKKEFEMFGTRRSGGKPGKPTLRPDLFSAMVSQAAYGRSTTPKFTGKEVESFRSSGYMRVPSAELMKVPSSRQLLKSIIG